MNCMIANTKSVGWYNVFFHSYNRVVLEIIYLSYDHCSFQLEFESHSTVIRCFYFFKFHASSGFSSIMVPLQSSMTVTLPGSYGESYDHNPFPGIQPSIVRFDDKVRTFVIFILMLTSKLLFYNLGVHFCFLAHNLPVTF